eukprot:GHVT01082404.1.p1 GENE.GHVT01082404.1~~GHVT01082404.1.p1  ORF type:complete len:373 (+),score=46.94 GHVT01082404.1:508-1626(+)
MGVHGCFETGRFAERLREVQQARSAPSRAAEEAYETLQNQLQEENIKLTEELRKARGDTDTDAMNIQEMMQQVRELLLAFGVPWVDATAEAEAQCAVMTELGLCEAVITDDSDALVFGARQVFRHFFESSRSVETYEQSAIQRRLGLTKKDLAYAALLLGCDYTTGVKGIGIVNALETIKAFPSFEDLKQFKTWAESPWSDGNLPDDSSLRRTYKEAHRNYRLQWEFPDDFPNEEVIHAFANPVVDRSKETFSWSPPDPTQIVEILTRLTDLTAEQVMTTLGSVLERLKDQSAGMVQRRIDEIFAYVPREPAEGEAPGAEGEKQVAVITSKRMEKAVKTLRKRQESQVSTTPTYRLMNVFALVQSILGLSLI